MNFSEYQKLAHRTLNVLNTKDENRRHMILGVISELGEIADVYKKHLAYGRDLDRVNLAEELADFFWYVANFATLTEKALVDVKFDKDDLVTILNLNVLVGDTDDIEEADILFIVNSNLAFSSVEHLVKLTWYMVNSLGFTDEEFYLALDRNINKLQVRYPDKFSNEHAMNRDLDSERKALEG